MSSTTTDVGEDEVAGAAATTEMTTIAPVPTPDQADV
jgi:hypothetical protein